MLNIFITFICYFNCKQFQFNFVTNSPTTPMKQKYHQNDTFVSLGRQLTVAMGKGNSHKILELLTFNSAKININTKGK